ncbi:DUF1641 domain-containing protein [Paenibacillus sp. NPDC058367]|uniref:DUF1641 domain-containing protein n=1 Tax=Paenibacillus sp. NPDC058367 TaxID=3346460 RepID=UPI003656C481
MSETITQTQPEQESPKLAVTQEQMNVLEQLLKPEVQESLTVLVEQLPKLTELVGVLTKSYDFVQTVAADEVLKSDTVSAIKELAEPVVHSAKNMAATVIEAQDRANKNTDVIGVFGLMKMMKDPQAQKLFRFVNAYLQVAGERSQQK